MTLAPTCSGVRCLPALLAAVALVACPDGEPAPDAARSIDSSVQGGAADRGVSDASVQDAGGALPSADGAPEGVSESATPPTALTIPEGKAPRRYRRRSRILDCQCHAVWDTPEGWDAVVVGSATLVVDPSRTAMLAHFHGLREDLEPARELVRRVTGEAIDFAESSRRQVNRHVTIVEERSEGSAIAATIVQGDRRARSATWVSVSLPNADPAAVEQLGRIRESFLLLTSHACACGYDCSRPQER